MEFHKYNGNEKSIEQKFFIGCSIDWIVMAVVDCS